MTATQTPPERTRTRRGGLIVALMVAALFVVALIVGMALVAVLGVMVITPTSTDGGPVPVVESTVPAVAIPDGHMFVFVTEVGGDSVTVDPARMLNGQEARDEATADGVIAPGQDLPGDFYIDNPDTDTMTIGVEEGTAVTVLAFDSSGGISEVDITLSDLAVAFTGEYSGVAIYGLTAGEFPMTVTVEDGAVAEMAQVYLP